MRSPGAKMDAVCITRNFTVKDAKGRTKVGATPIAAQPGSGLIVQSLGIDQVVPLSCETYPRERLKTK